MASKPFTTTLDNNLLKIINDLSKQFNSPKNKIIEIAVFEYYKNIKKENLKNSFKKASKDNDVIKLSEYGLEDYNNYLKKL